MSTNWKNKLLPFLEKYKAPLLVLLLGITLMLIPTGSGRGEAVLPEESERLALLLSETKGVGESLVLVSENGVVVVCDGAENAAVRLDIIRAVGSYTGFGSDRITILKLAH